MKHLSLPVSDKNIMKRYKCKEEILVDGVIYTARDTVHHLVFSEKAEWPFPLSGSAIFYTGPTHSVPGFPLGSCGPTTSSRMDRYTPGLYGQGLAVTIGKGPRSPEVVKSIKKNTGLYLIAYGGCGALYGSRVTDARLIGFRDLGPQAVYRIEVRDFPVIVGIDTDGADIYGT
ncbi:MAG: fumarate hydratase C-terminal domain-containing protein [Elusimicrobiota bacterium]